MKRRTKYMARMPPEMDFSETIQESITSQKNKHVNSPHPTDRLGN